MASFDPPMGPLWTVPEIASKGAKAPEGGQRRGPRVFFDVLLIYPLVIAKEAKKTRNIGEEALIEDRIPF